MGTDTNAQELNKRLKLYADWGDLVRQQEETTNRVTTPLYHYTNMVSLQGMIEHEKMWLTSIFHVNDPSEFSHGLKSATLGLAQCLEDYKDRPAAAEFCKELWGLVETDYGKTFSFFIGSFSRTPNDLPQWRSYADNGRGVAIKVAPEWFHPSPADRSRPEEAYMVAPVVYSANKAQRRQYTALAKAAEVVANAEADGLLEAKEVRQEFFVRLRIQVAIFVLWNALTTKHPAYKSEAETRLILLSDVGRLAPVTKTRLRGSELVPYVPIEFPLRRPGVLLEVMVGPAAGEPARTAVARLLRANGFDPTNIVTKSDIPYRA